MCVQDIISGEFIHKLESLLQRAYRLQEEFEGALGMAEPSTHCNSQGEADSTHASAYTQTQLSDLP